MAVGESSVILLHPPLRLLGASIGMERGVSAEWGRGCSVEDSSLALSAHQLHSYGASETTAAIMPPGLAIDETVILLTPPLHPY